MELQQAPVTAGPQGEGLAVELLPGLLVRLGSPLVVPVRLQVRRPEGTDKRTFEMGRFIIWIDVWMDGWMDDAHTSHQRQEQIL